MKIVDGSIRCEMCSNEIELNDFGVLNYNGVIFLCDECSAYIENMIYEYAK